MSQAAQNSAENIQFPTFESNPASAQFRAFAEQGMEQSKQAFTQFKLGAEGAQKAFEASFESAKNASSEMSSKSIAAMRASTELTFSHFEALLGVKSLSDFAELQSSFLREQCEIAMNGAKDLQTASTRSAEELARPVKDMVERAWGDLKVA